MCWKEAGVRKVKFLLVCGWFGVDLANHICRFDNISGQYDYKRAVELFIYQQEPEG